MPPRDPGSLVQKTADIARDVAAVHAVDVDGKARFPRETFAALKEHGVLGAYVPRELGGAGSSMRELAAMCTELGQRCSSSGMVLAMHHIQVACLVRHAMSAEFFRGYLAEVAQKQLLIASVTSEVGVGGDTRSSICAVERQGDRFVLNKDATTISYGADADALLATARREPDAAASDQVLVLAKRGDYKIEQTTSWDTLGMRGTCSPGFKMSAAAPVTQIVPGSFADSSGQTMVPFSHILWSGVWLGIATDAVARASASVRAEARRKPGTVPPTASRLAEVSALLQTMNAHVQHSAAEFDELDASSNGRERLLTIGQALKMNNLKVSSSQLVVEIVHRALQICGILGYKNDSKISLGRHLRDAHSAALMIGNDRIYAKSASLLLVYKDE